MPGRRIELQSRIKWTLNGTSRTRPARETLQKVVPLSKKIGVTRLADITDMDVLGIPNYSAVLPGTEDYIWVYSGKGPTKEHAMASALMESIERYSSLPSSGGQRNFIRASYSELSRSHKVLHPDEIVEPMRFEYRNDMQMDFLPGFDIANSNEEVMVPASIALFRYNPQAPAVNPFSYFHTNGLASGNVMEEAVCHSLCEVIERDAMSIAELRASAIPFHMLRSIVNSLGAAGIISAQAKFLQADKFVDDPGLFPDVDISDVEFEPVKKLVRRFERAGIPLIIKDITSDIGIPTFNASSIEWVTHDYGYLAEGHGTHPDARIALLRAITEVSQTRAANIQGARDDLRKIRYGENNTDDKRAWQFMPSTRRIKFSEVRTYFHEDILDDIKFILERLRNVGLGKAIIVDLTNPDLAIPVVRAIVPGLETFKITKSVMGTRARALFRQWQSK
ncbi:MAG TPA: YcaO-like family protein [Nitrososphaera sp.]|nr:YcaO-like family protein [Nitrososphaera sp.]